MKLKNKKAIGLFLSLALALCVVVPGTLAAEADTDVSDNPISIGEVPDQSQNNQEMPVDIETPSDADKECTCVINEDGTLAYTEGCPVHEAPTPDEPETPKHIEGCSDDCTLEGCTCSCHAEEPQKPAEPETPAFTHKEGCSDECDGVDCDCSCHIEEPETPTEPETPAHIEGCSDECTNENCACSCHEMSLFDRLMACETYEELVEMVDAMTEEELLALTEEQIVQVEEKLLALEPEPLPEIILDENGNVISEALADDEPVDEEPFVSEIIYPTVNFDNVAPFGDPVIG